MARACPECGEVDCSAECHVPTFEQIAQRAGLTLYCTFGKSSFYTSESHQIYVSRKWVVPSISLAVVTCHEQRRFARPLGFWSDPVKAAVEIPKMMGVVQ